MKRFEVIWGKICFSCLITVLLLLGLEFASRKCFPARSEFEKRFPVQEFRHPAPYVMFSGLADAPGLNSHGYKGPYPEIPKPKDEIRVLVLGGSTVVEGYPTFCELLQEGFSGAMPAANVHVYNLGVVSSVSGMEVARIVHEACDLQPDIIVDYNGGNDLFTPLLWDPRPGYPFNFIVYEKNPVLESDLRTYPILPLLAYSSNLLRHFLSGYFLEAFTSLESIRRGAHYGTTEWQQQIAASYVRNMVKAAKVSEAFGSDFVVFFQPLVYWKTHPTFDEQLLCKAKYKEHALMLRTLILRSAETAQAASRLNFFDLSTIYDEVSLPCYIDFIHTRQEVKPIVAQAMLERLQPFVRKRIETGKRPAATTGDGRGVAPDS
jgi:hypothetical protein